MLTNITSYAELQKFMTDIMTANISSISGKTEQSDAIKQSPHGAFWTTLKYDDFVNGQVPKLGLPILVKGKSKESNLILALQGAPPFDGTDFERMPADGPPFFTDDQIASIAAWIDAGCPQ